METDFEATHYYDPLNLTFPSGAYICVVDIDNRYFEISFGAKRKR